MDAATSFLDLHPSRLGAFSRSEGLNLFDVSALDALPGMNSQNTSFSSEQPDGPQEIHSGLQYDPAWYLPGGPRGFLDAHEVDGSANDGSSNDKKSLLVKLPVDLKAMGVRSNDSRANTVVSKRKYCSKAAKTVGESINVTHTVTGVIFTGVYWTTPVNDVTIPSTNAEVKSHVDEIVIAMRNNRDCREREHSKSFLNRWATGATYYTSDELEAVAEDIVTTMIDVHRNGWTKNVYDKEQRGLIKKTMSCTFEERFDGILELLKYSKRTCQDILKGERLHSVIGNPFELIKRTA